MKILWLIYNQELQLKLKLHLEAYTSLAYIFYSVENIVTPSFANYKSPLVIIFDILEES